MRNILLSVYWSVDNTSERSVQNGKVTLEAGNELNPPLTPLEMQHIAFAAKMAFVRVVRARREKSRKTNARNP